MAEYFACAKLGLVCVPVNLSWRPEEVAYVLDHSGDVGLVRPGRVLWFADRYKDVLRGLITSWAGT